jgi:hypothetical protein
MRIVAAALLAGALLLGAPGCVTLNLETEATAGQVETAFARAQKRAERHAAKHMGEKPHRVHVLALEEEGGDMVQVSVPMWMVRMALRFAEEDEALEIEGVELDWREVLKQGSGIFIQVEEEDERVLVWLE